MTTTNKELQHFNSFAEFYPFYLAEHRNTTCRRLHFIGSTLVLALLISVIASQLWALLWLIPVIGYGFAWICLLYTSDAADE